MSKEEATTAELQRLCDLWKLKFEAEREALDAVQQRLDEESEAVVRRDLRIEALEGERDRERHRVRYARATILLRKNRELRAALASARRDRDEERAFSNGLIVDMDLGRAELINERDNARAACAAAERKFTELKKAAAEATARWAACVDRGAAARDVLVCVEDIITLLDLPSGRPAP